MPTATSSRSTCSIPSDQPSIRVGDLPMNDHILLSLASAFAFAACAAPAHAAVSAEEAKQLGTTLTAFGAEKAGNKEGTIPAYTGGLTTAPAGYKAGDGLRLDPFASEKPTLVIDAKNAAQYGDKLTEGTKALLKAYP